MQNIVLIAVVAILAFGVYLVYLNNFKDLDAEIEQSMSEASIEPKADSDNSENSSLEDGPTVLPISHASMVLTWSGKTIYVDPVGDVEQYTDIMAPDLVLITDIHRDHFSTTTLSGVVSGDSVVVAPQVVYDEMGEALKERSTVVSNGQSIALHGVTMTAVPMYNIPESDDAYHTKGRGNGYVLEHGGVRVYIAGDTGPTDEMRALSDIDMAFIPMNLPYTMSVDDAAAAVLDFAPETVIPYHYRGPDGLSDVEQFKSIVESANSDINVLLLNWYPSISE